MLTLVPAILSLLGDRIDWPRKRHYDEHVPRSRRASDRRRTIAASGARSPGIVTGRPARLRGRRNDFPRALSLPYFDIVRGQAGIDTLPASNLKTAYTILQNDFSVGVISPVEIVIDGKPSDPNVQANIQKLTSAIATDTRFGTVALTTNADGADDLAMLSTPLNLDPSSEAGRQRHQTSPQRSDSACVRRPARRST